MGGAREHGPLFVVGLEALGERVYVDGELAAPYVDLVLSQPQGRWVC